MPEKQTIRRARPDKRQRIPASRPGGEFVHDEIQKIRKGKQGARSAKQAIAIGLSQARHSALTLNRRRKDSFPRKHIRAPKARTKRDNAGNLCRVSARGPG